MQRLSVSIIFLFISIMMNMKFAMGNNTTTEYNRPVVHFTPQVGWMNDPNGQWYDNKEELWHLYFQHNPNGTIWGEPLYWGHATSKDLAVWDQHGEAIGPDHNNEGIFSGNIVVDHNNTSGFFNNSIDPDQRVVAIYTYAHANGIQNQEIAYSLDAGYTFTKYKGNPVLNLNSTQFRDPKVFWHEPTSQWIMVVSKSQEYKVEIYGSVNLKNWSLHSNFSSGIYGFQYECPGLIEVPIENSTDSKWVLFLAVNPGSPIGGSFNQYFVGDFDGFNFVADDTQTRIVDVGKDFYAFQTFSDVEDGVVGLAWASNWQYSNFVPTKTWRNSMTLARNYTLREVHTNPETSILTLIQKPIVPASVTSLSTVLKSSFKPSTNNTVSLTANNSTGVFDFTFRFKVTGTSNTTQFKLLILSQGSGSEVETIYAGFDAVAPSWFFNRNMNNEDFDNEFFTDKFSAYTDPIAYDSDNLPIYELYGFVDRNIIELYFNDGALAMTNTFFMTEGKYPHLLELVATNDQPMFEFEQLELRHLSLNH